MDKVLFSSNSNEWATPQLFFDRLNAEFNFTLDSCATPENAKCSKYYTQDHNGLLQNWQGETVFCNPPYSKGIIEWIKKCYEESLKQDTKIVMLIPSRTDTIYFHKYIFQHAKEIRFVEGRIKFENPESSNKKDKATFGSIVVIYDNSSKHDPNDKYPIFKTMKR